MPDNKYVCPECEGEEMVYCSKCGNEAECTSCDEDGLNHDDPDVRRVIEEWEEHVGRCPRSGGYVDMLDEDGQLIGLECMGGCRGGRCDWKSLFEQRPEGERKAGGD